MTSPLLRNLLSDVGMTPEDFARAKGNSGGERLLLPKQSVQRGPELDRVIALPRRVWEEDGERLAELLTEHLRFPGGPNPYPGGPPLPPGTQKLRPVQAVALRDAHDMKGMFGPIRVGGGKTLISLLACVVLGAKRPLLLVPAKLVEKTRREMHTLRTHWLIPGYVRLLSYEMLGREQSATTLDDYDPDIIIADEAHKLANRSAAVTRRVGRYLEAHESVRFIAMSGTVTKRSIRDYAHIAKWCLRDLNPTPRDFNTLMEWSQVLDEKRTDETKLAPGALIELCTPEEREKEYPHDPVRTIRRAYRRRLVETPGVVATQEGALGTSLRIDQILTHMPEIKEAVTGLRRDWVRPDGEVCIDAVEQWRHLREVACGFFYRWNPAPPREWLQARATWAAFVRNILRTNRSGIDSELQVQRAVDRGDYDGSVLKAWRAIRDTFQINTEAVWLSDGVLKTAEKWMRDEKGIVWVEHTEFGHELERRTGVPFYWRQGQDKKGRPIEDHPVGSPLIASIAANGEGRNLQAWSTNFIVSCPTTGRVLEQLIGRTHRDGQEADEVVVTLSVVLREQIKAFDRARADARYISDTTGQEQKLCYADIDVLAQADAP